MTTIEPSYSARYYPRLALLALGLFVVGTNAFVIAGLLPDIAATLDVRPADVSYSITFYAIVVAVAAPAVAILLPRVSRTTLMASGLGLIAVGTVIAAAAPTLGIFTVGRIVAALGGAALVPAATAAAASLAPAVKRGQAIAFVTLGFTLASALGSPLGTALGAAGSWQLPLYIVAAMAAVLGVLVAFFVRRVPLGNPVSIAERFAPLRDHRIVVVLGATLFMTAGFNVVYIFSSEITSGATNSSGTLLAVLLLIYGLAGTVGNLGSGFLTDRFGNRRTASAFMIIHFFALVALPIIDLNYLATAIVFAVWGLAAFSAVPPLQHRLIGIDPAASGIVLSWYTTAMYAGIALAPLLGGAALAIGGAQLVPDVGAGAVLIALVLFQLGYLIRRRSAEPALAARVG